MALHEITSGSVLLWLCKKYEVLYFYGFARNMEELAVLYFHGFVRNMSFCTSKALEEIWDN